MLKHLPRQVDSGVGYRGFPKRSRRTTLLALGELADFPLAIRTLEECRGFYPTALRYLENIAHMISRGVHRVVPFKRCAKEHSEAFSNIPNPNRHYVAWMNFPQHYCTGLLSYRIEILRNRKSCRVVAAARLGVGLPSSESF